MFVSVVRAVLYRRWARVCLAVCLMIGGLAPVGLPILSDASWRNVGPYATGLPGSSNAMTTSQYDWRISAEGSTDVFRSDDGARTWYSVAGIPARVEQIEAVASGSAVFARTRDGIWASADGGMTWSRSASLPSRALSMVASQRTQRLLWAGTESVGLFRSNDSGDTWAPVDDLTIGGGNVAPLAVTALAVSPDDDNVVYAATGFWMGTNPARLTPIGAFVSVDQGRTWLTFYRSELRANPVERIAPVQGHPLAADLFDGLVSTRVVLGLGDGLIDQLDSPLAEQRAAAARAIALVGDRSAVPALLDHFRDPDALAGEQISRAIGSLGDTSAVSALVEALDDESEAVREHSALALGMLAAASAVPDLSIALQADQPAVQRAAGQALGSIATPEALAALMVPLSDREMTSRRHAAMAGLEVAGAPAAKALTGGLIGDDADLRANSAEMLGWMKATGASQSLAAALSDPDASVRSQAAWALGELGSPEARIALEQALESQPEPQARAALQNAMERAEVLARQGQAANPAWADALLGALVEIPPTRWTLLGMLLALSVLILVIRPSERPLQSS